MTSNILYTQAIQQRIDNITSDEELLNYLKDNTAGFKSKKASAKKIFFDLLSALQGTRNDADLIQSNPNVVYDYSNSRPIKALTVLEYYKYNTESNPLLKIYSDEFFINQILDNLQHEKSIGKDFQLPSALKSSFPSKHVINDLRLGFENKKPFKNDALRKTIIILFFYKYWCEQELNISLIKENFRYSTFIAEMDNYLNACGFEPLYIGNPYDWIFIFSSKCTVPSPLDTFRDIYEALINTSNTD